jgi:hypothetical protein
MRRKIERPHFSTNPYLKTNMRCDNDGNEKKPPLQQFFKLHTRSLAVQTKYSWLKKRKAYLMEGPGPAGPALDSTDPAGAGRSISDTVLNVNASKPIMPGRDATSWQQTPAAHLAMPPYDTSFCSTQQVGFWSSSSMMTAPTKPVPLSTVPAHHWVPPANQHVDSNTPLLPLPTAGYAASMNPLVRVIVNNSECIGSQCVNICTLHFADRTCRSMLRSSVRYKRV